MICLQCIKLISYKLLANNMLIIIGIIIIPTIKWSNKYTDGSYFMSY